LAGRLITEQQLDDLTFERMKTDCMIDLQRVLSLGRGLLQLRLGGLNEDGLQVA